MTAAEENGGFRVGERVFVHPARSGASFTGRGVEGRVTAIEDGRVAILVDKEETPGWFSLEHVRRDRRRARPAAPVLAGDYRLPAPASPCSD